MFESLKLYKGEEADLAQVHGRLVELGYKRQPKVAEEGDFAQRGGILDIFPLTFDEPVRLEFDADRLVRIKSFDIATGTSFMDHQMAIVLPVKGIVPRKLKSSRAQAAEISEDLPINNLIDISPGDHVVHVKHGIGRYKGIERVKEPKGLVDYIVLEYADGAKLFVPMADMNLIQKYIGFEGRPPKLYKLGTRAWALAKARAQKGIYSLALEYIEIQAKREALKGYTFSKDTDWQAELQKSFPFKDTPAQLRATKEIKHDMESPRPMDRLVCGDVGDGKTEVAIRAAFQVGMAGEQAAVLVPTTLLAEQHYQTFVRRLAGYPVRVANLSRFGTRKDQAEVVKRL